MSCAKSEQSQIFSEIVDAIKEHDNETVALLLQEVEDVNMQDRREYSLVHFSAMFGNKEALKMLLDMGADKYLVNDFNQDILHFAVSLNYVNIIQYLVEKGYDCNIKDIMGNTPIFYAKSAEAARLLLENGARIDVLSSKNRTALFYQRDIEVVELLVNNGVELDVIDVFGFTAALLFYEANFMEGVRLLINHGADISIKNKYGFSVELHAEYDGIDLNAM